MKILEITKVRGHTSSATPGPPSTINAGVVLVREPEDSVVLPTLRTIYYGCEIHEVDTFTYSSLPSGLSNWYILMTDPGESGLVAIPLNTNGDVPYTTEGQSEFFRDTIVTLQEKGVTDDHTRRVVAIVYSLPDDDLYDGPAGDGTTDTDIATSTQYSRGASQHRTGSSTLVDMCLAGAWLGVVFLKDLKQLGTRVLGDEIPTLPTVDDTTEDRPDHQSVESGGPTPIIATTGYAETVIDITPVFENRLF